MATDCCKVVGNFPTTLEGIISISSRGKTDVQLIQAGGSAVSIIKPSTGTVSISAYASYEVYTGCPGRASVSVNWIRKSDCDNLYFLYAGAGASSISGNISSFVIFPNIDGVSNPLSELKVVNASASSGPGSLYEDYSQQDGYGLIYTGYPWNLDTSDESTATVDLSDFGDYGDCLLQSLNLQCTPGQLPIVNMDFIYNISNG